MIRLRIDLPFNAYEAICQDRGSIKNIIDSALSKYGYHRVDNRPVRYGFGVISKPTGKNGLRRVERVYLGSSDPEIASAMNRIAVEDLVEPSLTPCAGLDLRKARIFRDERWIPCEALSLYALSPIRVLTREDGDRRTRAILDPGPDFTKSLNRIMSTRFGRPFNMTFIPDRLYTFSKKRECVGLDGRRQTARRKRDLSAGYCDSLHPCRPRRRFEGCLVFGTGGRNGNWFRVRRGG